MQKRYIVGALVSKDGTATPLTAQEAQALCINKLEKNIQDLQTILNELRLGTLELCVGCYSLMSIETQQPNSVFVDIQLHLRRIEASLSTGKPS